MSDPVHQASPVKVRFFTLYGGPENGALTAALQLVRQTLDGLGDRQYGTDMRRIDVSVFADGAVTRFEPEGLSRLRYIASKGEINARLVLRESSYLNAMPDEVKLHLSGELRKLFRSVVTRVKRSEPDFRADVFIRDADGLLDVYEVLPLPEHSNVHETVLALLKNYLLNRRLAISLGDPVPLLNWREGYEMKLDSSSPGGVRFIRPDSPSS